MPLSFVKTVGRRFGIAKELLSFLMEKKRWWMFPMVLALLFIGVLVILAESSAIAPFIYTLF